MPTHSISVLEAVSCVAAILQELLRSEAQQPRNENAGSHGTFPMTTKAQDASNAGAAVTGPSVN
eukprot:7289305-Pyramimonas_sp.AAC.1